MNTCLAKPFFKQAFPASMLRVVTEYFDLVAPVHDFSPSQLTWVIAEADWMLDKGINIIIGPSGSGKTGVLEAMKKPLKNLAPVGFSREVPDNLSVGPKASWALEAVLWIQPQNTCLMIDDAMGKLDRLHIKKWCNQLRHHDKQVVMAMSTIAWQWSAEMFKDMPVKLFQLGLPPRK